MSRRASLLTILTLCAVSALGQERSPWRTASDIREGTRGAIAGTVTDVDEARRQLQLAADNDRYQRVNVLTDSVSTQYLGFGGVINDAPEIFTGSTGFANVRVGDRLEVRGTGRTGATVMAEHVTLLGRSTPAGPTGVGGTRTPTSVSTPTATSNATADVFGRVEGVVRQVNAVDNRIVLETDRREILTLRTTSTTPVYYRGEVYPVRNLEVGDRIRVETDASTTGDRELRARVIDVVASVQERGSGTSARVSSISGRVTRVERSADLIRIDTGREEIRVDVSRSADAAGRRIRASDFQVGDAVDISGSYSGNSDIFLASTVRLGAFDAPPRAADIGDDDRELGDYVIVTISGTVTESLQSSPTLRVRDRASGRTIDIFVTEDFVYRTRAGTYATADRLAVNDPVLVKAYRDEDGNHVAQTIRVR